MDRKKNNMEIVGAYCKDCKIFTENVEEAALSLIYGICNHPIFEGAKIRIMPDVHAGKGIVIGFSCPIGEGVSPAHVGCDIGCTMSSMELSRCLTSDEYAVFEHRVKQTIPTGFNINENSLSKDEERMFFRYMTTAYNRARSSWPERVPEIGIVDEKYITNLLRRVSMDEGTFYKSLGTLGGGNHFLEYGETDDGRAFFTAHCGSRNFGLKVFNYWNKISTNGGMSKTEMKRITDVVKSTVTDKTKIAEEIKKAKDTFAKKHANGYLYNDMLEGYLSDMVIAQAYASFNHAIIRKRVSEILIKMGIKVIDTIETTHNYIDFNDHIIRKGSINASKGNKLIIPFNMRDGLAICTGKGNDDWNCTAPHGAGRIMSRSAAAKNLSLDVFKKEMKNVYSTSVCKGTLDESPMAYKDTNEIISLITPTVEINFFVRPKINIKATDGAE